MKKRNSLRLRRALSMFSIVLVLFSQGTPAFANVVTTTQASEAVQNNSDTAVTETKNSPENTGEVSEGENDPTPAPTPVPVDKTVLTEMYNQLQNLINTEDQYRPSTFPGDKINELFQEASVMQNANEVDQNTVDALVERIKVFLGSLQLEVKPDKESLQALLKKAITFKANEYTPASFKVLQKQIGLTNTLLTNEDASSAEVSSMLVNLQKAITGLVKEEAQKPTPTPKPDPKPETKPNPKPKPQPNKPATNKPNQAQQMQQPPNNLFKVQVKMAQHLHHWMIIWLSTV